MIFDEFEVSEDLAGALLAHTHRLPNGPVLKKGLRLRSEHCEALMRAGMKRVWAARLETGDVEENEAASVLARACIGPGVRAEEASTGRVNLFATVRGRFDVARSAVDRINLAGPQLTLATVEPGRVVDPNEMVATVKIIPFAVPQHALDGAVQAASQEPSLLRVDPFQPRRVALILTELPGVSESQMARAEASQTARIHGIGAQLRWSVRVPHETEALREAVEDVIEGGAQLVLMLGASAMVDPLDILPAAIRAAGGELEQVGMPVDPGNLLVLGQVRAATVIGVPGCARSPKRSGFDWVLERIAAEVPTTAEDIRRMGTGGLLSEIPSRPRPRKSDAHPPPPRVAALVLAAGRSTRMGDRNKLLEQLGGKPLVAHIVDQLLATPVDPLLIVTGHEQERVRRALRGRPVKWVVNPDYADGLSTSLRSGLQALDELADGILVALGDMPFVGVPDLDRLLQAFQIEDESIYVPVRSGQRGNPVLFSARFLPEMLKAEGDQGAKSVLRRFPDKIVEVEVTGAGVHIDVDTPEALAAVARRYELEVEPTNGQG